MAFPALSPTDISQFGKEIISGVMIPFFLGIGTGIGIKPMMGSEPESIPVMES